MGQSAADDYSFIGQTVGNYKVTEKLGEGGMGSVYLAEHPLIGKKVALKVLHAEFVSDPDVVARFFTEAKAVNDIQHPNIVDIIDYGTMKAPDGGDVVFFLMEYLEGKSLHDLIQQEAPLPEQRAFAIASQIADALGASHHHGIVHRDLKPDNVFLINRGRRTDVVKVLDFGIAKLTGDQPGSRRTRTGVVIGTPYYMSPEQCEGRGNVDHRTDVYALGIVLYELMTGRVPFQGDGYGEILVQHITQLPPRPISLVPSITPYAEAVVLKALEKHRDLRYPTMDDFMAALANPVAYVDGHGGLQGFLSGAGAVPVYLGVDQASTPTRAVGVQATPAPGLMTPAPGYMAYPAPTGVGQGAEGDFRPPKSKLPWLVLGAAAVIGLVAVLAMGGGGDGEAAPAETPAVAAVSEPEQPVPAQPEPVAAPKVELRVVSRPDGADVFLGDEAEPRGQTPLELELDASEQPIAVRIVKDGFESESRKYTPDANLVIDVDLRAVKVRKKKPDDTKPKKTKKKNKRNKVGDDILAPDL